MLAYGVAADFMDEYLKIEETIIIEIESKKVCQSSDFSFF
jgi:hypothetical protein